jgi:hypothetical protein
MQKEIVWCLQGALELGTLWETENGVEGEFLGKPRKFDNWTEARAEMKRECWRWQKSRSPDPED